MAVAVSVLTPTIPERRGFLKECRASVRGQTFRSFEHLVEVDKKRKGCSYTLNRLAERAHGEWLFILADDDLMLPGCLDSHMAAAADDVDIVYAPPLVWGEAAEQFFMGPPNIPATALIRAGLWRDVGGYDERLGCTEDRNFFGRAASGLKCSPARFVRCDASPTWVYRFHGQNKSRLQPAVAPLPFASPGNITDPGTTLEVAHGR